MDAPTTVLPNRSRIRRQFFSRLLGLKSPVRLNLSQMAIGMGVHNSLLSRYLREAERAGWVRKQMVLDQLEVTILDRDGLARAVNGEGVIGQVAVRDSHP